MNSVGYEQLVVRWLLSISEEIFSRLLCVFHKFGWEIPFVKSTRKSKWEGCRYGIGPWRGNYIEYYLRCGFPHALLKNHEWRMKAMRLETRKERITDKSKMKSTASVTLSNHNYTSAVSRKCWHTRESKLETCCVQRCQLFLFTRSRNQNYPPTVSQTLCFIC